MVATGCAHNVPTKRLYSIKELVAEIGATEWFWRSQIWDGQLPYIQVGRKMFIDNQDILSIEHRLEGVPLFCWHECHLIRAGSDKNLKIKKYIDVAPKL